MYVSLLFLSGRARQEVLGAIADEIRASEESSPMRFLGLVAQPGVVISILSVCTNRTHISPPRVHTGRTCLPLAYKPDAHLSRPPAPCKLRLPEGQAVDATPPASADPDVDRGAGGARARARAIPRVTRRVRLVRGEGRDVSS